MRSSLERPVILHTSSISMPAFRKRFAVSIEPSSLPILLPFFSPISMPSSLLLGDSDLYIHVVTSFGREMLILAAFPRTVMEETAIDLTKKGILKLVLHLIFSRNGDLRLITKEQTSHFRISAPLFLCLKKGELINDFSHQFIVRSFFIHPSFQGCFMLLWI